MDVTTSGLRTAKGVFVVKWWWGVCALMVVVLAGCGELKIRHPVPEALVDKAQVPGMPTSVRTWGDVMSPEFFATIARSREQAIAYYQAHPEERPATEDMLALSGGGENGAFGAGLLYGWSEAGNRPRFRLVTGISTGARIAPFAFIGKSYDERLKAAYTTVSTNDLFEVKDLLYIFRSDSATNNAKMRHLLEQWIDADTLRLVAEEHAKGRRLFIATVNLEAQRLVIWDMGAIAGSRDPGAGKLFRDVMLASASIPIVFPPMYLDVVADGKHYDEMQVDGGAISQTFLWDASLSLAEAGRRMGFDKTLAPIRLFIIRNAIVRPEWKEVGPVLGQIGPRAIDTLLKSQGIGDLFRLYATSQRDGIDYNVAYIPDSFRRVPKEAFDKEYMSELFEVGRKGASGGYPWKKTPFELSRGEPVEGSEVTVAGKDR